MKRIIAVSLFALAGGGLAMACSLHDPSGVSGGPAVLLPQTGGGTQSATATQGVPAGQTAQPNG